VNWEHLARAYGARLARAESADALRELLAEVPRGVRIIEVPLAPGFR
jgi:hypothetical protein